MSKLVTGLLIFAVISIFIYVLMRNMTEIPDSVLVVFSLLVGAAGEWIFYRRKS